MKLLLVEDETETISDITRSLREHGHTVNHAGDGYEGLWLAQEGNYDVIILDRMIPKLDGMTLLKTLREVASRRLSSFSPRLAASKIV